MYISPEKTLSIRKLLIKEGNKMARQVIRTTTTTVTRTRNKGSSSGSKSSGYKGSSRSNGNSGPSRCPTCGRYR